MPQFLAKYDPDGTERRDLQIYKELVDNDVQAVSHRISVLPSTKTDPWPWRKHRVAQEWLDFYLDHEDLINQKAEDWKNKWAARGEAGPSQPRSTPQSPT